MGNLRRPNASEATRTTNRSRSIVPMSGLCSVCKDGCKGGCEVWLASFRGTEVIYPGPFGTTTAGADKDYPVDYSHLNIQGYAVGAVGLPEGVAPGPDTAIFPQVDVTTEYGWKKKVKLKVPVFTGALGSTEIARTNWEHFAIGAAISGITLVCGENVAGIDPKLELDRKGKVKEAPELDRRIDIYNRYHEGYGEILVQLNVEDTRFGVAEYIIDRHQLDTIELKWGQGAKSIGGEIKVKDIDRAVELKKRGYVVLPDPALPEVQRAWEEWEISEFERHSRLGFVTREAFFKEIERLRGLGFKRITLKTGAYSMKELAMALRWGSEAKLDLITIDGAPGGTGMSPWVMMNEWGIPTFYLESLTHEFCEKLTARGLRVPDIAIAGGFSSEDGIYKAIAMGSPYVKAVCMGRALMIPGMVGKNIGQWLKIDNGLPRSVERYGTHMKAIFLHYEELKEKYGKAIDDIPLGAMGVYSFTKKLRVGLQQLMAGSRKFRLSALTRSDLMALSEEAAQVSGIAYVMNAYREEAEDILAE